MHHPLHFQAVSLKPLYICRLASLQYPVKYIFTIHLPYFDILRIPYLPEFPGERLLYYCGYRKGWSGERLEGMACEHPPTPVNLTHLLLISATCTTNPKQIEMLLSWQPSWTPPTPTPMPSVMCLWRMQSVVMVTEMRALNEPTG